MLSKKLSRTQAKVFENKYRNYICEERVWWYCLGRVDAIVGDKKGNESDYKESLENFLSQVKTEYPNMYSAFVDNITQ